MGRGREWEGEGEGEGYGLGRAIGLLGWRAAIRTEWRSRWGGLRIGVSGIWGLERGVWERGDDIQNKGANGGGEWEEKKEMDDEDDDDAPIRAPAMYIAGVKLGTRRK